MEPKLCILTESILIGFHLTAIIFESGPTATPTKSRNSIILGPGGPASCQCSNPSRFRHWRPSFGQHGRLLVLSPPKLNLASLAPFLIWQNTFNIILGAFHLVWTPCFGFFQLRPFLITQRPQNSLLRALKQGHGKQTSSEKKIDSFESGVR